jgi:hypothetical protein
VTSIVGGLQFVLPDAFTAGNIAVRIQAGSQTLNGMFQVQPVIETLQVVGQTLEIRGKGWSAQTANSLELYLSGVNVKPWKVDTGLLIASLPTAETFGTLDVQIVVNQQTSRNMSLLREAGSATGKVRVK